MRVFEIQNKFGYPNLVLTERAPSALGPGDVRVRIKAVSLNYRDHLMVQGHYNPRQPLPLVPCSDGVGIIEEVGKEVGEWQVGDRVAGVFAQKWQSGVLTPAGLKSTLGGPLDGMLTEEIVLPADGVVAIPEHLSPVQAATLPCAALTAWNALVEQGNIASGQTVLIQGTGGVALFALQFALLFGARTVVLSRSTQKLERAQALGAHTLIHAPSGSDWAEMVKRETKGEGVDHIVEVGGASTLTASLKAVKPGGVIHVIGVLSGVVEKLNILPILMRQIRLQGIFVGSREHFEKMNRAIDTYQLQPCVDQIFPFEDAPSALASLQLGQHFGKICLAFTDA